MKRQSSSVAANIAVNLFVGMGLLTAAFSANSADAPNEYFWPAFQKSVEYKAKSHAIRGAITLVAGDDVTIDNKVYKQVVVQPKPSGMPGIAKEIFIRADATGLYARYSKDAGDSEVLALALPAEKGKSWTTVDQAGKPSKRIIEHVGDCDIKGLTFERCVRVSFESSGGAAVAFYAPGYGEIVNSRKNGFLYRTIKSK